MQSRPGLWAEPWPGGLDVPFAQPLGSTSGHYMNRSIKRCFVLAVLSAFVSAGCLDFLTHTTSPSTGTATLEGMTGSWASVSVAPTPAPGTCTNFHWSITTFSGTTGSGTFTATCAGNVPAAGTASGTLSG